MWESAFVIDPLVDYIPSNAWCVSRSMLDGFRRRPLLHRVYPLGDDVCVVYTIHRVPYAPRQPGVAIDLPFQWTCELRCGPDVLEKSVHRRCHTLYDGGLERGLRDTFPQILGSEVSVRDMDNVLLDLGVDDGWITFRRHVTLVRVVIQRMKRCTVEYRQWDRRRALKFFRLSYVKDEHFDTREL